MQVILAVGDVARSLEFYERASAGRAYLYVRVDDVRDTITRLQDAGGGLLSGPEQRSWGEEAVWFADPDGDVVAVAQPVSASLSQ